MTDSIKGPLARVPTPKANVPRPIEYAHIVLRTHQPQRVITWYEKALGLQIVLQTPIITFLTWDDSQDRLAVIAVDRPEIAPNGKTGIDHIAFNFRSLADVVAIYRILSAIGSAPYWCINHGVATSYYFRDPDGRGVELSVSHFSDAGTLNAWLGTGDFNRNPIGVTLDPEWLALEVERGRDERELLRPHPGHASSLDAELRRLGNA